MNERTPNPVTPSTLRIIRVALLAGPVVIALIGWFLRSQGTFAEAPVPANILSIIFSVVALGGLGVLFVLRNNRLRATNFQKIASLDISGWAVGEGIATVGAVIYMLSGALAPLAIGFLLMLASFGLFKVPDEV